MFYDHFFSKYIKNKWLRLNLEVVLVALIVGSFLNLFFWLLSEQYSNRRVFITFGISYVLTFTISHLIALTKHLGASRIKSRNLDALVYYAALLLGVSLGTELIFLLLALFGDYPYQPFAHMGDLKFNLFISVLVGTMVYISTLNKENYELKLKEREFELGRITTLKSQAELSSLQSRINPHFLYNALNSIVSLIHERPDAAEEMTIKLSKLFRHAVGSEGSVFGSLKEELELLELYLSIERVRFADRIEITTAVDHDLLEQKFPRFLLQPIVENALKHGLQAFPQVGKVEIQIRREDAQIRINVYDSGPNFPTDLHMGYGLQSTMDKLEILFPGTYELSLNNHPRKNLQIIFPI